MAMAEAAQSGLGSGSIAGLGSARPEPILRENLVEVRHMPEQPLQLLHELHAATKALVDELHLKCKTTAYSSAHNAKPYSVLMVDPAEIEVLEGCPCAGE